MVVFVPTMASQRETDTQKDDRWHPLVRRALRQELRDGLIDTYSTSVYAIRE